MRLKRHVSTRKKKEKKNCHCENRTAYPCSVDIRANRYANKANIAVSGQVLTLYAIPLDYSERNELINTDPSLKNTS